LVVERCMREQSRALRAGVDFVFFIRRTTHVTVSEVRCPAFRTP
jgi:hypothetical protein